MVVRGYRFCEYNLEKEREVMYKNTAVLQKRLYRKLREIIEIAIEVPGIILRVLVKKREWHV